MRKWWKKTSLLLQEQILWAVEEKADFIIAETYSDFGEAKLALEAIIEYGKGKESSYYSILHVLSCSP